jgi:hypothetical protein
MADDSNSDHVIALSFVGNAPSSFVYCPNAFCSNIGSSPSVHPLYDWAVVISCNCTFPATKWYFCRLCKTQRKPIVAVDKLKRHHWMFHQRKRKSSQLSQSSPCNSTHPAGDVSECIDSVASEQDVICTTVDNCSAWRKNCFNKETWNSKWIEDELANSFIQKNVSQS